MPEIATSNSDRCTRTRGVKRAIGFIAVIVVIALCAFAAVTAVRLQSLKNHTDALAAAAAQFIAALANDSDFAQGHLDTALTEIRAAQDDVGSFPIPVLEAVSWVEHNTSAVETLLNEVEGLLATAGPTLVDLAQRVDISAGQLRADFSSVSNLWGQAQDVSETVSAVPDAVKQLRETRDAIGAIETAGLLPHIATGVDDTYQALDDAYSTIAPLEASLKDISERFNGNNTFGALQLISELFT